MGAWDEIDKQLAQQRAERDATEAERTAPPHTKIVCPHCQTAGHVTHREVRRKKRLTVTRVLGATLTAGASLPITGVSSKKGAVTEMTCSNCRMQWDVA